MKKLVLVIFATLVLSVFAQDIPLQPLHHTRFTTNDDITTVASSVAAIGTNQLSGLSVAGNTWLNNSNLFIGPLTNSTTVTTTNQSGAGYMLCAFRATVNGVSEAPAVTLFEQPDGTNFSGTAYYYGGVGVNYNSHFNTTSNEWLIYSNSTFYGFITNTIGTNIWSGTFVYVFNSPLVNGIIDSYIQFDVTNTSPSLTTNSLTINLVKSLSTIELLSTNGGVAINTNNAGGNALEVLGNVDSTIGFTINGQPIGAGGLVSDGHGYLTWNFVPVVGNNPINIYFSNDGVNWQTNAIQAWDLSYNGINLIGAGPGYFRICKLDINGADILPYSNAVYSDGGNLTGTIAAAQVSDLGLQAIAAVSTNNNTFTGINTFGNIYANSIGKVVGAEALTFSVNKVQLNLNVDANGVNITNANLVGGTFNGNGGGVTNIPLTGLNTNGSLSITGAVTAARFVCPSNSVGSGLAYSANAVRPTNLFTAWTGTLTNWVYWNNLGTMTKSATNVNAGGWIDVILP